MECNVQGGQLTFLGQTVALPPAIACPDCAGELLIPVDAFTFGGDIKAKLIGTENYGTKKLLALELGGRRLYAMTEEEVTGETVGLSLDAKKLAILSGGEEIVSPMPATVSLGGKFRKVKVQEEVDGKKKKVVEFKLSVEGVDFPAPERISTKLLASLGVRRAFSKELRFECTPYDITFAEDGIPAEVVKTVDYGTETFAVCKVGEREFFVKTEGEVAGRVHLVPALEKLAVIQADMDIRLV